MAKPETYFLPYQAAWLEDQSRLRICEKGRQVGISYVEAYRSVRLASSKDNRLDVWVISRDDTQARQYLIYCKRWAHLLGLAADDLGEEVLDPKLKKTQHTLRFASGLCIHALSSNPDAIVGKSGHVVLDEFALHKDQRELYSLAKPVTQWGGGITLISTHRGVSTLFNEIIRSIKEGGNKMGWSLHTIPIQRAVDDGIVEKINAATGKNESRSEWLERQRAECIDEEQWLQEYCCIPADESSAFISYDMITACEDAHCMKDMDYLRQCKNPLYLGGDIGRVQDLTVWDVGEMIGDVMWDRMRIEMANKTFAEQEDVLYQLLQLPALRRACIDASGLGRQLAERAKQRFGWKVEPVVFTAQVKEELAFPLRAAFEDRHERIERNDKLRADLRGIKKETTAAGNIRFVGESDDSHCDRFWAKALRRHAAQNKVTVGAMII